MKILALSGSLRNGSSSAGLLGLARDCGAAWADVEIYRGLDQFPFFSPEIDVEPGPSSVHDFRNKIRQADALLICTPEYAFGIPGVLKNALDWLVSSGEMNRKPTGAISASPTPMGGDKAYASLLLVLTALGAEIVADASFSIPMVYRKLGKGGSAPDPQLLELLRGAVKALAHAVTSTSHPD